MPSFKQQIAAQLRQLCKEKNLPGQGNKRALIKRLEDEIYKDMEHITQQLADTTVGRLLFGDKWCNFNRQPSVPTNVRYYRNNPISTVPYAA